MSSFAVNIVYLWISGIAGKPLEDRVCDESQRTSYDIGSLFLNRPIDWLRASSGNQPGHTIQLLDFLVHNLRFFNTEGTCLPWGRVVGKELPVQALVSTNQSPFHSRRLSLRFLDPISLTAGYDKENSFASHPLEFL